MISPKSLIYGQHVNSPKFRLTDSQLRFSTDDAHKILSETTSTTVSPKKRPSIASSVTSFPLLSPDLALSNTPYGGNNLSVLSYKPEVIPISYLYSSPRPQHQRHRSDIPYIAAKDMILLDANKEIFGEHRREKNSLEPKVVHSLRESMALNLRQNSTSITSLHTPENPTGIDQYLKYLDDNSNPIQLRKSIEEKIYGKTPIARNSSLMQDSTVSYKLIHVPSTTQLSKSGSIGGKSHLQLGRSFLSRKPSSDSLAPSSPYVDSIVETSVLKKNPSVIRPKLKPINFKPREEELLDGSPNNSQCGITPKKNSSKLTHSHSRRTGIAQEIQWHNQYSDLFIDLAHNLRSLYTLIANEKKIHQTIERFASNNPAIINLSSSKSHKIYDYDFEKLQKKFSLIEVSSENFSIPERLEKQRLGLSIIDPTVIRDLDYFNSKLEDFILLKKQENLKQVEDRLIMSENKLREIQQKKLTELKQKGRVKEYNYAEKILAQKPRIDPFYFFQFDPVSTIDSYQNNNGDLKYVKKKNIEQARTIAEVFNHWVAHINS